MKKKLVDLIIPAVLIIGCLILLGFGIDGEVKAILAMAAGWTFRTSIEKKT